MLIVLCFLFFFLALGIYICTYLCYIMSIHIIYTYIIIHLWISYDIYSIHIISHHYILYIFSISPWNICSFFSAAPSRSSRFDPFEILEVSPGASAAEVKKAPTLFWGFLGMGHMGKFWGKWWIYDDLTILEAIEHDDWSIHILEVGYIFSEMPTWGY